MKSMFYSKSIIQSASIHKSVKIKTLKLMIKSESIRNKPVKILIFKSMIQFYSISPQKLYIIWIVTHILLIFLVSEM